MSQTMMSPREFAQQRWALHRDAFRVGSFAPPGGGHGFLAIDRIVSPPTYTLIALASNGSVRAIRGDIADDISARDDISNIAARALDGDLQSRHEIPVADALRLMGLAGDGMPGLADLSVNRYFESLADPRLSARLNPGKLAETEWVRFDKAGLGNIKQALHPGALQALAAVSSFKWRDYSYYAAPDEKGDIRRTAASHYPLFAGFVVERFSVNRAIDAQVGEKHRAQEYLASDEHRAKLATPTERGGVTRTLEEWIRADGRDPNAPWQLSEKVVRQALQTGFGQNDAGQPRVANHVFTNLRGVSWTPHDLSIERIVEALGQLPADWIPKTREDWDAFCDLTATAGRLLPTLTGTELRVLYEGCGGKWSELRERTMRAFSDTRPPEGATEEDVAYIEANVDFAAMALLPRDKVGAAAIEAVAALDALSPAIVRTDVEAWIRGRITPDVSRAAIHNACIELEEMTATFARKVILPLAANEATRRAGIATHTLAEQFHVTARESAAHVLLPGKSLVRLMEMTRAFINRGNEIAAAGEDEETQKQRESRVARERAAAQAATLQAVGIDPNAPIPENGWAPLSAVVEAPNGVFVVPLTDPSLLADEGRGWGAGGAGGNADGTRGLGICVGSPGMGYAGRCQREGEHIVSFRERGGVNGELYTRLSCLQLAPIQQGVVELRERQHRGRSNGAVPEKALRAWEWYQQAVRTGAIPLNYEAVRSRMANARAAQVDEVALACGYDWKERERIVRAMTPWAPFVGKKHRKMGPDAFALDADVQAVVECLDPSAPRGPRMR